MTEVHILYPVFALAGLTLFCVFRLGYLRYTAVRRGEIDPRFFRLYRDYDEPEYLRVRSRHVINLHEAPLLFYLVCVIAFVTNAVTLPVLVLAWVYVALRFAHSYIHQSSNIVLHRFRVFASSQIVLALLWLLVLATLLLSDAR